MAADVRLFVDEDCTQEVVMDALPEYLTVLSTLIGLNGHDGDRLNIRFYLKNVGTRGALHVTLTNANDSSGYIVVRTTSSLPDSDGVTLVGDLAIGDVYPVYFCVTIPRYTANQHYVTPIYLDYYTLPEKDTAYYNPYNEGCDYCKASQESPYFIETPYGSGAKNISDPDSNFYVTIGDDTFAINPSTFDVVGDKAFEV